MRTLSILLFALLAMNIVSAQTKNDSKRGIKTKLTDQANYHFLAQNEKKHLIGFCRSDQTLEIRNNVTGELVFFEDSIPADRMDFSSDGEKFWSMTMWDNKVKRNLPRDLHVYSLKDGKKIWSLSSVVKPEKGNKLIAADFSPSGTRILALFSKKLLVLNTNSGQIEFEFEKKSLNKIAGINNYIVENFIQARFTDDKKVQILVDMLYVKINPLNAIASRLMIPNKGVVQHKNVACLAHFDVEAKKYEKITRIDDIKLVNGVDYNMFLKNKFVFNYSAQERRLMMYDIPSKDVTFFTFPASLMDIEIDTLSNKMYYTISSSPLIYRFDINAGKQLTPLENHIAPASDLVLSADGKSLISSDVNGIKNFWNLNDDKLRFSLYTRGAGDFIIADPGNYYYASKGALQDVAFVIGRNIYDFESFDLRYNRPDIILKTLNPNDSIVSRAFYLAYQKRLKRMNFTEASLSSDFIVPKLSITEKDKLPLSVDKREFQFSVDCSDSLYNLDRIVVTVNNVLAASYDLKKQKKKTQHQNIALQLSSGKNRVVVSCYNSVGVESIKESFTLVNTQSSKGKVYYFGAGCSTYKDGDFNLRYAAKDVRDMSARLRAVYKNDLILDTLTDKKVTKENVLKWRQKMLKTTVDDIIIISFSGHGVLNQSLDFYFATHTMDFMKPEKAGMRYDEIETLLEGVPARNRLVLIDACHSGELDKDEQQLVAAKQPAPEVKEVEFRGRQRLSSSKGGGRTGFELMKNTFADLGYTNGTHVISAAAASEYALESDKWKNGVFTYTLLSGLCDGAADVNHDGHIAVTELREYIYENVVSLTGGKQQPTARRDNITNDFELIK